MWFIETSVHQRNSRVVQRGLEKNLGNKGKIKIRPRPPSATVPHRNHAQVFTCWVGMHRRSQACPVAQLLGDSCKLCKHIIKPINLSLSLSFFCLSVSPWLSLWLDNCNIMCLRQFRIFIKLSSVCRHVICINICQIKCHEFHSWLMAAVKTVLGDAWCHSPCFQRAPAFSSSSTASGCIRMHQASDSKRFLARQTDGRLLMATAGFSHSCGPIWPYENPGGSHPWHVQL